MNICCWNPSTLNPERETNTARSTVLFSYTTQMHESWWWWWWWKLKVLWLMWRRLLSLNEENTSLCCKTPEEMHKDWLDFKTESDQRLQLSDDHLLLLLLKSFFRMCWYIKKDQIYTTGQNYGMINIFNVFWTKPQQSWIDFDPKTVKTVHLWNIITI